MISLFDLRLPGWFWFNITLNVVLGDKLYNRSNFYLSSLERSLPDTDQEGCRVAGRRPEAAAAAVDAANPAAVDATAETAGPPAAPAAAVNATVFTQKQLLDVYDSCSPEPPKSLRLLLRKADVLHRANLTNEPTLDDEGVDVEARNNAARDICLQLFELPPLQEMSAEETSLLLIIMRSEKMTCCKFGLLSCIVNERPRRSARVFSYWWIGASLNSRGLVHT